LVQQYDKKRLKVVGLINYEIGRQERKNILPDLPKVVAAVVVVAAAVVADSC